MAIAYDNATKITTRGGDQTVNINHAVSGSDRILLLFSAHEANINSISSASYNGDSLTKLTEYTDSKANSFEIWYLLNPDTGTNSLQVVYAGSSGYNVSAVAISYTGVDQTDPIDAYATGGSFSGDTISRSITTTVANCMLVECAGNGWDETITPESGQTTRSTLEEVYGNLLYYLIAERLVTTATTYTEQWSDSDNFDDGMSIGVVSLTPVQSVTDSNSRPAKSRGADDVYSRENKTTLPTDTTNLGTLYNGTEETNVGTNDGTRVALSGTNRYLVHMFKKFNTSLDEDKSVVISANLQTSVAPSVKNVILQIYNHNTPAWETLDTESSAGANTDFDLTATVSANTSYYQDAYNMTSVRIVQDLN